MREDATFRGSCEDDDPETATVDPSEGEGESVSPQGNSVGR